jgi:anti-sigma factor RsiW
MRDPKSGLHVATGDLALYVLGGLEGARLDEVEAHVLSCEACAARLAREARLEVALGEVALRVSAMPAMVAGEHAVVASLAGMRARSPRARAMRSGRFMGGALGALAAAAGIVLMFAQTSHADTVTAQQRSSAFDGAPGMMGDISGAISFEGKNASGTERGDNLDGG